MRQKDIQPRQQAKMQLMRIWKKQEIKKLQVAEEDKVNLYTQVYLLWVQQFSQRLQGH